MGKGREESQSKLALVRPSPKSHAPTQDNAMPIFIMIGHDGPDGRQRRNEHRAAHVAHLDKLDQQGKLTLGGPLRNEANDQSIGAVIVFEAADLEAARRLAQADPFVRGNVFETITVSPFKAVYPKEQP